MIYLPVTKEDNPWVHRNNAYPWHIVIIHMLSDTVGWLVFVHFNSLQVPTALLHATKERFTKKKYQVYTTISDSNIKCKIINKISFNRTIQNPRIILHKQCTSEMKVKMVSEWYSFTDTHNMEWNRNKHIAESKHIRRYRLIPPTTQEGAVMKQCSSCNFM
jgi:hypothetical protein